MSLLLGAGGAAVTCGATDHRVRCSPLRTPLAEVEISDKKRRKKKQGGAAAAAKRRQLRTSTAHNLRMPRSFARLLEDVRDAAAGPGQHLPLPPPLLHRV